MVRPTTSLVEQCTEPAGDITTILRMICISHSKESFLESGCNEEKEAKFFKIIHILLSVVSFQVTLK